MEPGKALITIGSAILVLGLVLNYAPWLVNWFGKLPGDIRIQNKTSFVFIPISSMIVVSVLITLLVNLFFRK
ncbi:DUF2905 domain-containing protein [Methylomonas fluvii]|uniref:DUF2905 domain-containing protein n=1 Tax=Methylomonas fluvii TaxID=1854564 RepID=A0ABR9DNB0_9GAMM|nr:DUF2905 domain-containing protein [Methylomonas fluvii]MBD9363382.1 DUF2905 domain-containing protein [Methylomonas fluvii]